MADEFALIARLFAPLTRGEPEALGLKDDAALLDPPKPGHKLAVTTDTLVEGVHFPAASPPDGVARKALRVNLSDLAAMGAAPRCIFISAAFPQNWGESEMKAFAHGLGQDLEEFGIFLAGGDTTATPGPLTLAVTAIGEVSAKGALTRSGAKPGDGIWVSGTIGDGTLGLAALQGSIPTEEANVLDYLTERYHLPQPRLQLGRFLSGLAEEGMVTSCMDISDGLVQDMGHICRASHVGARLEAQAVPLSDAARSVVTHRTELLDMVFSGGDDYELLFTAAAEAEQRLAAAPQKLTRIGWVTGDAKTGSRLFAADGAEIALAMEGYKHFR